jgi:hypothetical protein
LNPLFHSIAVNNQGVVLDGHHRFKACQELGISEKELKIEIKKFKNKLEEKLFVIDCNLTRRHLNSFQRTELALKSKPILEDIVRQNNESKLPEKGEKGFKSISDRNLTPIGKIDEQIGRKAGVSRDTVRKVQTIIEKAPEEVKEELRTDQISINNAFEYVDEEYPIPTPYDKDIMEPEKLDDAELREITIHAAVRQLGRAEHDLWVALTGKKNMPNTNDDVMVDHIRPTQQFRNNLFYELATGSKVFKISLNSHFTRMNQLIELLQNAIATIQKMEK